MKRIIVGIVIAGAVLGPVTSSHASDWDKAGKALAVIEGARILTGGNVDIIGNIIGIGRGSVFSSRRGNRCRAYTRTARHHSDRIWVPNYVWKKKRVPRHEEYHRKYGTIVVESHYIRCRVERGGHWK